MKGALSQASFWRKIRRFYRAHGRDLPWRRTKDPYKILVSEVMLQQTQVLRVIPKYREFLKCFPTLRALARASERDVLLAWQGLGYNRRGLMLRKLATMIRAVPRDPRELAALPGIGPYTAAAIAVFAYGAPIPMIETNIRRVFLHEFFVDKDNVADRDIIPLIRATMPRRNIREWYYALMDYGAALGTRLGRANPNRRSAHYARQSQFEGSNRQKRGRQLKAWLNDATLDHAALARRLKKFFPLAKGRVSGV